VRPHQSGDMLDSLHDPTTVWRHRYVVIEGDHQRSDAFRRGHIDVSAGPDQRLDAVIAAVAGGIQQRGKSPDGTILSAGSEKAGSASRYITREA
jgi:hypothetical protein